MYIVCGIFILLALVFLFHVLVNDTAFYYSTEGTRKKDRPVILFKTFKKLIDKN